MRNHLMRSVFNQEIVCVEVAFGLTKALDEDETSKLTFLWPKCLEKNYHIIGTFV